MSLGNDLFIERQTASKTQTIGTKEILIVVKQCNFLIVVRSPTMTLEGCEVKCTLLYDTPEKRPVPFVNSPPIKFKAQQSSTQTISIESKLSVLSSQHEDMLFIVKIEIFKNKEIISTLFSDSIKVTSKLESKKKPKFDVKKLSEDKKPKTNDYSTLSHSSSPRNEDSLSILLSLIQTNTYLIQQIKQSCDKNINIQSFESGFKQFIQSTYSVDYNYYQQFIIDSLRNLSDTQFSALDEISSVFHHSRQTAHPFVPFNQNSTQPQQNQFDQFNPSSPPMQNPFLRKPTSQ